MFGVRSKRDIGILAIGIVVIALIVGWYFDMSWFGSLLDYLNAHGGWTYAYLIGLGVLSIFVAYVHKNPFTVALALLAIAAIIGAGLASPIIGGA